MVIKACQVETVPTPKKCIQHNREGDYPQGRELETIFNREAREDLFIYEFE